MDETTLPLAAGFIASGLTEIANRLTPNTKFPPRLLQGAAFTLAGAAVVGWHYVHGGLAAVNWNAIIPQVLGAWGVALAAHDVASPRKGVAQP